MLDIRQAVCYNKIYDPPTAYQQGYAEGVKEEREQNYKALLKFGYNLADPIARTGVALAVSAIFPEQMNDKSGEDSTLIKEEP